MTDSSSTPVPMAGTWKTLVTPPLPGPENMALDQALMERARRTGERVLRVYSWAQPTLSLGRHQVARNRIDRGSVEALGVALVRRPTGGRALLHHREVTYSVTSALARDDSVRAWYGSITMILLHALRSLGVDAQVAAPGGRTPLPATASCFAQPDEGEITVGGRKLVGSALLRQQDALLQHGSILLDDDQQLLNQVLPDGELRPAPAGTLRQALAVTPSFDDIASALIQSLDAFTGARSAPLDVEPEVRAEAAALRALYASDEWTFKY